MGQPGQKSGSGSVQTFGPLQWIVVAVGLLVFVAMALSPKSPSSFTGSTRTDTAQAELATPTPEPAHIGTVVRLGNWQYRVVQVDTAKTIDVSTSSFFKQILTAKGLWVMVMVDLTNLGTRNFSINDHDFQLRDGKGIQYDTDFLNEFSLVSFRNQTQLGEQFPPGVTLRTTLLYDVAPGTNGMYLYLSNVGVTEKPGTIYLY